MATNRPVCRSCGADAVRVAQYRPYRSQELTNRFRCRGCNAVFDQPRLKLVKVESCGSR